MKGKGIVSKMARCVFIIITFFCIISIAAMPAQAGTNWKEQFGEPQYGGRLVLPIDNLNTNFDPADFFHSVWYHFDQLFMTDWSMDRETEWSFKMQGIAPKIVGNLAESWEWDDPMTLVVHLRKGVHWQNKQPTHGREFVADDVVYHYNRILGQGEFTEPNPFSRMMIDPVEAVSKRDKYTAVIHFKEPRLLINWWTVNDGACMNKFEPREMIESGKLDDFRYVSSTGPYMITDYVAETSITLGKNPDYHLFDLRFPDKRLPYFDEIKRIVIKDLTTKLAALRSGKVDLVDGIGWQNATAVKKTNPEFVLSRRPNMGQTIGMRVDKEPFTDIRVRKAMQLAVDIKSIAENYLGGYGSSEPPGLLAPDYKGYTRPYKEWAKDLQEEYTYNPEKAKKLLAEAGYPNGFKTDIYAQPHDDTQLLEIVKAQFADIGIDMKIILMERTQFGPFVRAKKHNQMTYGFFCNQTFPINMCYNNMVPGSSSNFCFPPPEEGDPYAKLYQQFLAAKDEEEAKSLGRQMEEYLYRRHWMVVTAGRVFFDVLSPRIKGYSGEIVGEHFVAPWYYARFWAGDAK